MTLVGPEDANCGPLAITPEPALADTTSMGMTSFMDRSYRIGPDGRTVVCDTMASRRDIGALRDALAWRRTEQSRVELDDADTVLRLRSIMVLEDMLDATSVYEDEAPLTLARAQVQMLCEVTGAYVSERDVESYQPPEERERIGLLRDLAGTLMDCCSELTVAHEQAREHLLSV
jgi:hypothetical protein